MCSAYGKSNFLLRFICKWIDLYLVNPHSALHDGEANTDSWKRNKSKASHSRWMSGCIYTNTSLLSPSGLSWGEKRCGKAPVWQHCGLVADSGAECSDSQPLQLTWWNILGQDIESQNCLWCCVIGVGMSGYRSWLKPLPPVYNWLWAGDCDLYCEVEEAVRLALLM